LPKSRNQSASGAIRRAQRVITECQRALRSANVRNYGVPTRATERQRALRSANVRYGAPTCAITECQRALRSAKGARYDSQGQARSASPLVSTHRLVPALKGRNTVCCISAFQASIARAVVNQGRRASRLPLAVIFRAFGAILSFEAKPCGFTNQKFFGRLRG